MQVYSTVTVYAEFPVEQEQGLRSCHDKPLPRMIAVRILENTTRVALYHFSGGRGPVSMYPVWQA